MKNLFTKHFWIYLVLLTAISFSCVKEEEEATTGSIQLVCTDEDIVGAEYNVITENAFLKLSTDDIYLNTLKSSIKTGTVSNITEIRDLNPGTYYITFYKTTLFNAYKAVQVSAGKTNKYEIK